MNFNITILYQSKFKLNLNNLISFNLIERYLQQVPRSVETKFIICINMKRTIEDLIHSCFKYLYTPLKQVIYKNEKRVIVILIAIKIINFIFKVFTN